MLSTLELSWCERFGDGKRKIEQCRLSATSSYVVHATPKYMSFHVVDRKRTVVKWAMFPSFNMEIWDALKPAAHVKKELSKMPPKAICWGVSSVCGEILVRNQPRENTKHAWYLLRREENSLSFLLACSPFIVLVDRGGNPFNVFIIIQSFTMALLTAVSVFIILFAISLRYRGLLCASNGSLWTGIL